MLCFALGVSDLVGQDLRVSGTVVDEHGEPLIGAHVLVVGEARGAITDISGAFDLLVTDSSVDISVSMLGFQTEMLNVAAGSPVNITLYEDLDLMEEVVVIGYGTQKKEDFTGSISSIDSDVFESQPIVRLDNALSGRAAGVQVNANSGAPGGDVKIRIRGANSILGNNQPLIVIDGVIGADMQLISQSDIQSIDILKDASATAIYGSRGANGVVMITTREGTPGGVAVNLHSFYSVSELPRKIDYLSAAEFAELYNAYDRDIYYNPLFPYEAPFSEEQITAFRQNGGTDWQDELFQQGHTQSHEVSVRGANESVKYALSASLLDQEGILINTGFERFNIRSKVDIDLSEKWKLGLNVFGSRLKGKNNTNVGSQFGAIGRMPQWVATEPIFDENGTFYNNSPEYGAVTGNPVGLQNTQLFGYVADNYLPSASLSYLIIPGLDVKASTAIDVKNQTNHYFNDNYLLEGPSGVTSAGLNKSRRVRTQYSLITNYKKSFGVHDLQLTGIYEGTSFKDEGFGADVSNLNASSLQYYNLSLSGNQRASSYYYDEYLSSLAFRVNYMLNYKYLLTATVRRDGSSKFYGANKYSVFPSVALAWHLGDEAFIKDLGLFSTLKLRASYGLTGNQAVGSYGTLPYFVQNPTVDYSPGGPTSESITGLGIGAPGNRSLKWETTKQLDLGMEVGVWEDRVFVNFDYYEKFTEDLLLDFRLPFYAGNGTVISNIGEVSNKGFELAANAIIVDQNDWGWDVSGNISVNRNKVLDLGDEEVIFPTTRYGDADAPINIIKQGHSLGTFYGYLYEGVWKSSEAAEAARYGNVPGDAKYKDLNNDQVIDTEDLGVIGVAQPDFIFGLSSSVRYKAFSLNVLFQGVQGGQVFNGMHQKSVGLFGQSQAFTSPDHYDRWTEENENTDVPAFSTSSKLFANSSRWLEDGSYLRLKNVTAAYNLPAFITNKMPIASAQMYLSGDNLWVKTNYKGYDPEASSAGNTVGGGSNTDVDQNIDTGAYPSPRTVTVGLKIGF
ncbi:TonB-linked SusC/RagA family outer membrane protein [Marinoscillum furvescens DSM 4134]|uniref:TonB-linked SusC/RagA family outer membrane protein n=2 Tax=Marinoscillum furvescens TaxID=1026 RepID=A0A3D9L1Y7_MARFU|nr:TonB-linked SusC/RagA family outer membrane protein [Marinoscillum furvescens DSM 4134]